MPFGTYLYLIEAKTADGEFIEIKGGWMSHSCERYARQIINGVRVGIFTYRHPMTSKHEEKVGGLIDEIRVVENYHRFDHPVPRVIALVKRQETNQ